MELREDHLNQLASAMALSRSPNILISGRIQEYDRHRKKEIQHIRRKEALKKIHRKIGHLLKPPNDLSRLSRVDIPLSSNSTPYPNGPDPKTWQGPWRACSYPHGISEHICSMNARQYHQAHSSPFGIDPLLSYFGYQGKKEGATQLINGRLPPYHRMEQLLPETKNILHTLVNQKSLQSDRITEITSQQFMELYSILDERTSSLPSGRHLGHYKAVKSCEKISEVFSRLISIPGLSGFSPK